MNDVVKKIESALLALLMFLASPFFFSLADEIRQECLLIVRFEIEYDENDPASQSPLLSMEITEADLPQKDSLPKYVYGYTKESNDKIKVDVIDWILDAEASTNERIVYIPMFDTDQYRVADDALLPYCEIFVLSNDRLEEDNEPNKESDDSTQTIELSSEQPTSETSSDTDELIQESEECPAQETEDILEPSNEENNQEDAIEENEKELIDQGDETSHGDELAEENQPAEDVPEEKESHQESSERKDEYVSKSFTIGDVSLSGFMPEDADVSVKDVNDTGKKRSDSKKTSQSTVLAAYDISILSNGNEYQPDNDHPIYVEITCDQIDDDTILSLQHVKADGEIEEIVEFAVNGKTICFNAYGFSVYKVVALPSPAAYNSYTNLTFSDDITTDPVYVSVNNYYFTNEWWTKSGRNLIKKTSSGQIANGSLYYFEAVNAQDNTYHAYTMNGDTKLYVVAQYIDNDKGGLSLSDNSADATTFTVGKWNNSDSYFQISTTNNGKTYYWNMQGGNGGNGFAIYKTENDVNGKLLLKCYHEGEDDAYELDGKSFGIIYANSDTTGIAIMASETVKNEKDCLAGQETLYRTDSINGTNSLYVAYDTDITMWTFHSIEKDYYYISTTINGAEKYISVVRSNKLVLADTPNETCVIRVLPGTGNAAGKMRLIGTNGSVIYYSASNFKGFTGGTSSYWLSLVDLSVYSEEDFIKYSAEKISVSDIQNGDEVVIYTRIWNSSKKEYEFYLVNHDGALIRGYESGDDIVWINTKIDTTSWKFFEYYYAGTANPNYYYDFLNLYSEKYISPKIGDNGIVSDSPYGVNLNGRKDGDYYSTIIAWDDPYYDYAGLTVNSGFVKSAPMAQADQFSFAIVRRPGELHEVGTVDHEANGVTLKMIDFPDNLGQNDCIGGDPNTQGTKPLTGLLSNNLGNDGYPTSVITGESLGTLYNGATTVNHLFLESSYQNSGYYEFDSTQNFASLDGNRFKVYQELGTVDYVHGNTIKHGQFMPYNYLTPGEFCEINPENLYDALGSELSENNPRKREALYKIPSATSGDPNAANFYFGMEITADFVQPKDGLDSWGHDIIFEFTGDDDFWLYVDGKLVLDLGGVHSAIPGSVNFSTGVVAYRDIDGKNKTKMLYDIYRSNYEALGTMSTQEIEDELNRIFVLRDINGTQNYVFKDYGAHTMKIFYMERGAGASNLRMRFNLTSVRRGQVQLSKEIEGTEREDYASSKFAFQIHYSDGVNEHFLIPDNTLPDPIEVKYLNTSTDVEYLANYSHDGQTYQHVFFLKPGQTAVIDMPENAEEYWITECGVKPNIYDSATINGESPASTVTYANMKDYVSSRSTIEDRPQIVFKNHVNPNSLRTLSITKKLFDEFGNPLTPNQDETKFRFRLYLGDDLDYYRLGAYYVKDPSGNYCSYSPGVGFVSSGVQIFNNLTTDQKTACTFYTSPSGAVDKIPADYTIEVRDLLVGTKFKVTEDSYEIPLGYGMRTWTETVNGITTTYTGYKRVEGSYITEPGMGQNEGIIRDNNDPQIEIHNQRGFGIRANKSWSDSNFILAHGYVYFAVFIGNSTTPIPGTVRRIDSYNYTTYYFQSLEPGYTLSNYHVYEVELENVGVDANNNITYSSITRLGVVNPDETFVVSNNVDSNGDQIGDLTYKVIYSSGEAIGTVEGIQNVRTDSIRNVRLGGLTVKKTAMDSTTPLSGSVFTLEDSESVIGNYTSDASGIVAILYLEDGMYTLTETKAPNGYQRLTESFTINVESGIFSVSGYNQPDAIYDSSTSTLTIKNKPIQLTIVKVDSEDNTIPIEGAHFALYKEVQGIKSYYPLSGFEDIVTGNNGVLAEINELIAPGTYYLTETQAPEGYILPDPVKDVRFTKSNYGVITIDTSSNYIGTISQTSETTVSYVITITNEAAPVQQFYPVVLPKTGSVASLITGIIGFAIILLGAWIILIKKRAQYN